jgi:thiol-disulfide isomerase/thioredoxin
LVPLLAVVLLSGCSGLSGTGDLEYIQGDGSVTQVAIDDREDPVEVTGTALDGEGIDITDYRGGITVVNVWASWCPPCRTETPTLVEAAAEVDATFVGINIRESSDTAAAFERSKDVPYPSIHDEGGETLLQFGRYSPRLPPTTLVLDRQGRVAALINGEVPSVRTLTELVEEVAAEDG